MREETSKERDEQKTENKDLSEDNILAANTKLIGKDSGREGLREGGGEKKKKKEYKMDIKN